MAGVDLLISGGTVVTPGGTFVGDVAVDGERIAAVGQRLEGVQARRTIQANGRLVLPGMVDPHTHPGSQRGFADDIESETEAAAQAGVTTMLGIIKSTRMSRAYKRYTVPEDVVSYHKVFPEAREIVDASARVDVGFTYAVQCDLHAREVAEYAAEQGVTSYKFYIGYKDATPWTALMGNPLTWDDGTLFYGFESIGQIGGIACLHCENWQIVRVLEERVRATGRKDLMAWELRSPGWVEAIDFVRCAYLSEVTGARIYPVHVSARETVEQMRLARARGVDFVGETCPHYLFVDGAAESPGVKAKVNPPPRYDDDHEVLWQAIREGLITCIGSDHVSGFARDMVAEGNIWESLAGFTGMQATLPLMYTNGVRAGRITVDDLARLCATNPARTFGLGGRKGAIEIGFDADLIVVDTERPRTYQSTALYGVADYSPYDGWELYGWPEVTVLRGRVVYEDGKVLTGHHGAYLPRTWQPPAHPPSEAAAARGFDIPARVG
jgi:dihydropyrimidinase/dihydroorotase